MIVDNVFNQNDLIGAAMQASVVRNEVINNNIANAETVGYKKRAVKFETMFQEALNDYKTTGKLDFSRIAPAIQIEHAGYSYRIDENNVDIETEMVDLYQNSVKYDVLAAGIINNYKAINLAITAIK